MKPHSVTNADEVIKKVMDGERDFKNTIIPKGGGYFFVCDGYTDMNEYLRSQDLDKNPIDISGSEWQYVKAPGLYICLLYTSPSPRDLSTSRMPSSA